MNPKDLVGAKKAPLDLVPPAAIIAMAEAFGNGAVKYGPYNWREQPIQVRTYIGAAIRHLLALQDGQWAAEDTGISHLGHAMAGLAILTDAFATGAVIDNRVMGPAADLLRAQDKSVNPGDLQVGTPMSCDWVNTGEHDPWCFGNNSASILHPAFKADFHGSEPMTLTVERGPGGWYPCCGATEHVLECPHYEGD